MTAVDFKLTFNVMTYNDSDYTYMLRKNFFKHSRIKNIKQVFIGKLKT